MWLKVFEIVIDFLIGRASNRVGQSDFAQISLTTLRKAMVLFTLVIVSLILFFTGLFTIILDLVLSSRDAGALSVTTVSAVGLGAIVLATISGFICFHASFWTPVSPPAQPPQHDKPNPLHSALAELVMTFVEDKKANRDPGPPAAPVAFEEGIQDHAHQPGLTPIRSEA